MTADDVVIVVEEVEDDCVRILVVDWREDGNIELAKAVNKVGVAAAVGVNSFDLVVKVDVELFSFVGT